MASPRLSPNHFVVRHERERASRYRLLETMREYAHEKLSTQAEVEDARRRHFDFYLVHAKQLDREFSARPAETLRAFDADYENMRAALAWGFEASFDHNCLLQLATALSRYWEVRAHVNEGGLWFKRLLHGLDSVEADPAVATAFARAGRIAGMEGDYRTAIGKGRVALRMRRALNDEADIAESLNNLGAALNDAGRSKQAAVLMREALKLFRKQGNRSAEARLLCNLGLAAMNGGDQKMALERLRESLTLSEGLSDLRMRAFVLGALGTVSHHTGAVAESFDYNSRSLEIVRSLGDFVGQARVLNNLADVTLETNDLPAARSHIIECIRICEQRGLRHEYADALDNLAVAEQRSGRSDLAAQLIGAADAIRTASRQPLAPYFALHRQKVIASVQHTLGTEGFERQRLSGEQADPKQLSRAALG